MELDASSCSASTKEEAISGSLRQCVERLIEAHGGVLSVFAGPVQMAIGLDSYLWETPADGKWARWLSLAVERVEVDPLFADVAAAGQSAYLGVYRAFLHWSAALCALTQAWYGFGYHPRNGVRDERGLSSYLMTAHEEIAAGKLPDLRQWLTTDGIQYLAPQWASRDVLIGFLSEPGYHLQHVRNGGFFVVPTLLPFVEEDALAYRHVIAADTAIKSVRDTLAAQPPGQHLTTNAAPLRAAAEAATAQYRRALGIFAAAGDGSSAQPTQTRLLSLEPLIGRLARD